MELKKNKKNVIIIILAVLLLISIGMICFLLVSKNTENDVIEQENNQNVENNTPDQEDENNQNTENKKEEATITPVSYTPKCVDDRIMSEKLLTDIDETKYNNIVEYIQNQNNVQITLGYCPNSDSEEFQYYTLTQLEKNTSLNEIKNSRHFVENVGLGGGACVPMTTIKYQKNNKEYIVKYWGDVMSSNDGNIYKIIDRSINNTFTQDYCHYFISSLGATINNITKFELN
ncbi:MAG: hypothetical protein E7174_03535 [Firmicutes bacterium]|nr:hypothetical protein [Bacillota bacterium]